MESLLTQTRELQTKVCEDFTITEKAPTLDFSRSKEPTSAFTFKTPWRHYAKQRYAIYVWSSYTDSLTHCSWWWSHLQQLTADWLIIKLFKLFSLWYWESGCRHSLPSPRNTLGMVPESWVPPPIAHLLSHLNTHHGTLPSILISVAVPLNHHFSGYAKLFMLHQSFKKIGNVFRVVWWHNGWVEDMNDNLFWLYNLQQPWIVQKPKITSPPSCTSSVSKLKYCKFHRIMLDTKLCGASCNAIFQMKSKLLKLLFSLQIFHTDNQIIIFHMEVNQIK